MKLSNLDGDKYTKEVRKLLEPVRDKKDKKKSKKPSVDHAEIMKRKMKSESKDG